MEIHLSSHQLTQRQKKHPLQSIAKVVGVISIIAAFITGGYLLTIMDSDDKVIKSFYGSISFFCFVLGFVLNTIGSANLPVLSVPSDEEIKNQSRQAEELEK